MAFSSSYGTWWSIPLELTRRIWIFEEVDKEMEVDEAAQAATTALEENAPLGNDREPEDAPVDAASGDEATV